MASILAVDDDPLLLTLIQKILETGTGLRLWAALWRLGSSPCLPIL